MNRMFSAAAAVALVIGAGGCGAIYDPVQDVEYRIDAANLALGDGDCDTAIAMIDPIYNSDMTNNRVRLIRASAYACAANLNYFKLIGDLVNNADSFGGPEVWQLFTRLFPSSLSDPNDRKVEGAQGAIDALLASIKENGVIAEDYLFATETANPASMLASDRTNDSNSYLTFVSMAMIGAMNGRYGNPDPTTFEKTNDLPWETAASTDMDTIGCQYASAIVNFADSFGGLAATVKGETGKKILKIQETFQAMIYYACDVGCRNIQGVDPTTGSTISGWQKSGCTVTGATCSACPYTLRDRFSCTRRTNDINSCAAAGIVNFMNHHPLGWQSYSSTGSPLTDHRP